VNFALKLEVPSDPELLSVVRSAVKQLAQVTGFTDEECRSITVAVDEAMTNIIRHAYENRHDQSIQLVCQRDDHGLEFILTDSGRPVDPEKLHGRPLHEVRPGGLGMHIIRQVMDQVQYERLPGGNRLRLIKYLKDTQRGGE
jgi:anti-sigma regulatory factor (Ser/Thr protein kinase)